ncbi:hypothetical protein NDU88_003383 [Pleurodeles waltl]|uniref:Uncharacterized protein n=1 Tax=Pleurodeles waltl TaxID=8319 RepID=A0AAV7REY8_PLEWA|nr:hypothetical protein NDU88_003383 [Pleurodeles waltl]
MEPELQILTPFIFLLLYQEYECRRRRPRVLGSGAGGGGVLGSGAGGSGVLGSGAGGGGVLASGAGGCLVRRADFPRLDGLTEDGPDGGVVAAVEPVDSEDEEAEKEDIDNRNTVILQYFQ